MALWDPGKSIADVRWLRGFLPIGFVAILFYIPTLALLPYVQSNSFATICSVARLCASDSSPWGAVTGLSIFDGVDNLITFALCAMIFVEINLGESPAERSRRSRFFLLVGFGIGVFANLAWMLVTSGGGYTYGKSSIVYAFIGTIFAAVCVKGLPRGNLRKKLACRKNIFYLITSTLSAILAALFFISPLKSLMFEGPGLNPFVHEVAFVMSFTLTLVYYYFGGIDR
jgi:hypothetical protein